MSSENEANYIYFSGNNLWAGSILNVHYTDAMKWSIKTLSAHCQIIYRYLSRAPKAQNFLEENALKISYSEI